MGHQRDLHISIHKIMLGYLTSEYLRLWGISSASQCSRTTASVRGQGIEVPQSGWYIKCQTACCEIKFCSEVSL